MAAPRAGLTRGALTQSCLKFGTDSNIAHMPSGGRSPSNLPRRGLS